MPPVSHDARAIHGCLSMRSRDRISVGQEYEVMIEVNDGSETATVFRVCPATDNVINEMFGECFSQDLDQWL